METDKKSIKKMFPNLIKELEAGESKVQIDSIRADSQRAEEEEITSEEFLLEKAANAISDKFRHYTPSIIDFIRRCDTESQAEEIVDYLLRRGEITQEYAHEVKTQIRNDGIRSFGPKKESDYYFKQSGLC
jgi:hypothetical protein